MKTPVKAVFIEEESKGFDLSDFIKKNSNRGLDVVNEEEERNLSSS
jgi:hypothetical protein